MVCHQLIVNLRASSWDFIPDEMWRSILFRFAVATCNGVSFDAVTSKETISEFHVFAEHAPTYVRQDRYSPFSMPPDVTDADNYRHVVAVFEFTEWIATLMNACPFNCWNAASDGSHADELVLWADGKARIQAIPYEGQVYFHDLTGDERRLLLACDKRIEKNLYAV